MKLINLSEFALDLEMAKNLRKNADKLFIGMK